MNNLDPIMGLTKTHEPHLGSPHDTNDRTNTFFCVCVYVCVLIFFASPVNERSILIDKTNAPEKQILLEQKPAAQDVQKNKQQVTKVTHLG